MRRVDWLLGSFTKINFRPMSQTDVRNPLLNHVGEPLK